MGVPEIANKLYSNLSLSVLPVLIVTTLVYLLKLLSVVVLLRASGSLPHCDVLFPKKLLFIQYYYLVSTTFSEGLPSTLGMKVHICWFVCLN